jgi:hypothetical protein
VRMIERGHRARFRFEPPAMLFGEPLHRDDAIEPRVARFPHFSHATCAEEDQDFIGAEPRARVSAMVLRSSRASPGDRAEVRIVILSDSTSAEESSGDENDNGGRCSGHGHEAIASRVARGMNASHLHPVANRWSGIGRLLYDIGRLTSGQIAAAAFNQTSIPRSLRQGHRRRAEHGHFMDTETNFERRADRDLQKH